MKNKEDNLLMLKSELDHVLMDIKCMFLRLNYIFLEILTSIQEYIDTNASILSFLITTISTSTAGIQTWNLELCEYFFYDIYLDVSRLILINPAPSYYISNLDGISLLDKHDRSLCFSFLMYVSDNLIMRRKKSMKIFYTNVQNIQIL